MRKTYLLTTMLLAAIMHLYGQTAPVIGTPEKDTIYLGSGGGYIVIPGVDDGDESVEQEISFSVTSSNTDILEVVAVTYAAGQSMAVIQVSEQGEQGTVSLDVEATDADGSVSTAFEVFVGPYNNPGINFEIHDAIFWQEFIPQNAQPAFDTIVATGEAPYADIDLEGLELLVYTECKDSPPCTGTDFFTSFFKGYIMPSVSGAYTFYSRSGDRSCVALSPDEDFSNASFIIYSGNTRDQVGTSIGNKEWQSAAVNLEAGKIYALYSAHWVIHTKMGGILWEGPGISKQYIPQENLAFVYDPEKPSTPGNFQLITTGINDILLSWDASSDNRGLAGYRVYLNGLPTQDELIKDEQVLLEDLQAGTVYCVAVSAVDVAGNESAPSQVLCTTTYVSDEQAPTAPTLVEAPVKSDLYMELSWSGATDGESEVRGYRLYVDDVLYNPDALIYEEGITLSGLDPETSYQVELEALDAALNVSPRSTPVSFMTTAFDPNDTRISDKKGSLRIQMEVIGRSEGIGVNPNYKNGEFLNDPEQARLIRELEAGAVRWGALTANPLSFEDYIGTGKSMTFGRMMDFCNQIGAYTVICCGVENSTDWRTEPETFEHFLEYLAGSSDTPYGAIRASEGFSDPLLDNSPGLIFEFGNEVWGASSHDAQIGSDYTEYGQWCRDMAVRMKNSDYFDPDKIYLVYSGRRPVPSDMGSSFLHESMLEGDTGQVDWMALSGYLGGNLNYSPEVDPGKSELEYYQNGVAEVARNLKGLRETIEGALQSCGDFKSSYLYESNMSKSNYFGRLGQAVVQTDYYASAIENGSAIPTVFHLTGGEWKMVVVPDNYKKLPLYHTTRFFNRFCKGNALRSSLETQAEIRDGSGLLVDMAPVGCHVYRNGDVFTVLLISRDFANDYTVQLDLPDDMNLLDGGSAWKYMISGSDFNTLDASLDSIQVTLTDGMLLQVPKHSMVVLTAGSNVPPVEDVPLGFYDYVSATSVTISVQGGVYDISGRQKRILNANVAPSNVLSDAVIWSVEDNGIEVNYSKESYGFLVYGSGTCEGNGTIQVRASAWDNPEVYDEVDIVIAGQGSNCGVHSKEWKDSRLQLYPNPAGDLLHVSGIPEEAVQLEINDISGRSCGLEKTLKEEMELDLSGLEPGMYFIRLSGPDGTLVRSFFRK